MSNCTQRLFNSSQIIINFCLDKCDNLIGTQCICDCLNGKYEDNNIDYTKIVLLLSIVFCFIFVFGCCICQIGKNTIFRNNNIQRINVTNSNNAEINENNQNSEIILEINYYDLPKYEDIIALPNQINNNLNEPEIDNPPKYEETI